MEEKFLAKWLNDELSEEALAAFRNTPEFASYQRIVSTSGKLEAPAFNEQKALEDFRANHFPKGGKVLRMTPMRKFLRVAAVLIFIFSVSYYYVYSLEETVSTQYAERTEVRLPDQSEVLLNADSRISYNEKKWDSKRNVTLKGEAFFKVSKGKKFTVSTKDGLVTVLGTQFNVENRKGFFEVTCFEGLVSVSYKGIKKKLPAGASFIALDGKVDETVAPGANVPSWINRESTFRSIPLAYVLDEFQRQFDIRVETKDIDLNQLFTGTFSNTNMNLALQSISTPSRIKYHLEEGKVLFYGENAP